MFTIVVCSMVALTSMFPESYVSSSELRQKLAAHSVTVKGSASADNVDHLQAKWRKDEGTLRVDRAVLDKAEAKFDKDVQQVQLEVALQRKVVTDDENLQDVELSQLPRAEFEYHEAAAEAVVHPATHSVYLLDAKQNQEAAIEREIRDQEQQLKVDLTSFRQHKHVQLDINKEAAALSAEEKKLEKDRAVMNSDIAAASKQIKTSASTNYMLAADWSKAVNNLEEIKRVESEVETKRKQISVKTALRGRPPSPSPIPRRRPAVKQHLSEDDEEHSGTYEAATDSKAAAGIAGFAAAEVGGYHGAPTVFGARADAQKQQISVKTALRGRPPSPSPIPRRRPAVKQQDDEEHS
jgi:hypothetical protein